MIYQLIMTLMKQQENQECQICGLEFQKKNEVAFILKELLYNMAEILKTFNKPKQFKQITFWQLLKILFSQLQGINYRSLECNHLPLKEYFLHVLKCDQEILLILCEDISMRLVKRKYQLQVVKNLLRNLPEKIEGYYGFLQKQKVRVNQEKTKKKQQMIQVKDFNLIPKEVIQRVIQKEKQKSESQKQQTKKEIIGKQQQIIVREQQIIPEGSLPNNNNSSEIQPSNFYSYSYPFGYFYYYPNNSK